MPTAGAMISPGASDGPSWTVTMAMLSTLMVASGCERVGDLDGTADHDRAEAVDLAELLLPGSGGLGLARARQVGQPVDGVLGDDHEQGRVDGIDAFAEDGALPAALARTAGARPSDGSPRKARASWKLLQGTTRARVWLGGSGSPSRA